MKQLKNRKTKQKNKTEKQETNIKELKSNIHGKEVRGEEALAKTLTEKPGNPPVDTVNDNVAKERDSNKETPAMEVIKFSKRYKGRKNYAVENLNFKVYPGEFHGFIGGNGAGKTTTIKSLIGAYSEKNYEGDVFMFGHHNLTLDAKKRVGYIPEAAKFPKNYSSLKYITYMSYLSGLSMKESKTYAKKILEDVGLGSLMNKSPNTFSSGQKKKVLLAQALVHNPDIIIMDEPAANLDPQARFEFFNSLKRLQKAGKAIFISSHILSELEKFVDSITIIDGGKVVYTGAIKEVQKNPDLLYRIKAVESEKLIKILESEKLEFTIEENGSIVVKMLKKAMADKIQKKIIASKIDLESFNVAKPTLEEIYTHYVQLGSVDTEGKDIKRDELNKQEDSSEEKEVKEEASTKEESKKPVTKKAVSKKNPAKMKTSSTKKTAKKPTTKKEVK